MTTWRDVLGYEGLYRVSEFGVVERCDGYHSQNRALKPHECSKGYLRVVLSRNCKCSTFRLHKIVAEAFLGARPEGLEINHKDGNKHNNHFSNLEYVTHLENMQHANTVINVIKPTRARGEDSGARLKPERVCRGEGHKSSKLNDAKVKLVLQLLKEGILEQREIARIVGISQTQIWRIKTGQSWAHIKLDY